MKLWQNPNCDKTHNFKFWQHTKTQNVREKSKTQIVTKKIEYEKIEI